MHSFAVLDISPGLGNERRISDHAYFFKGVEGGWGGGVGERRKDSLIHAWENRLRGSRCDYNLLVTVACNYSLRLANSL